MKKIPLIGGLAAAALASAVWGIRAWRDTHPRFAVATYELRSGYSLELPAGWPKPDEEFGIVSIENSPDRREDSLDRLSWGFGIHDYGVSGQVEKIISELSSGCVRPPRVHDVVLSNGVKAKTFTCWEFMGELNQEHRGYAFKAPNGHVYSSWQPMARDWRTKRRYDNLFRAVLGSMKFKL